MSETPESVLHIFQHRNHLTIKWHLNIDCPSSCSTISIRLHLRITAVVVTVTRTGFYFGRGCGAINVAPLLNKFLFKCLFSSHFIGHFVGGVDSTARHRARYCVVTEQKYSSVAYARTRLQVTRDALCTSLTTITIIYIIVIDENVSRRHCVAVTEIILRDKKKKNKFRIKIRRKKI